MSVPSLDLDISWGTDPLAAPSWTSFATRVLQLDVSRGRNTENDTIEAGTLTVDLLNNDRALEPFNAAGPYYGASYPGNIVPNKRIRARGGSVDLFYGFIERITCTFRNGVTIARVEASDAFRYLERASVDLRLAFDTFDRSDASSLGNAEKGGAWSVVGTGVATAGIDQNRAKLIFTFPSAGNNLVAALVDTGKVDFTADIKFDPPTSSLVSGIVFRYQDNQNYCIAGATSTTVYLIRVLNGVQTTVQQFSGSYSENSVLLVRVVGNRATVEISSSVLDANIGADPGGTKHGFGAFIVGALGIQTLYYDDFRLWRDWPANEPTHTVVGRILDNLSWPAADRLIASSEFVAAQLSGEYFTSLNEVFLASAVTATATSLTLTANTGFAAGSSLKIDSETMYISAISGVTFTVVRGIDSAATSHDAGATVYNVRFVHNPVLAALQLLQELATTEGGAFYIGRDGKAVFETAGTRASQARSITSQVALGTGGIPILDGIEYGVDEKDIINRVVVAGFSTHEYTFDDTASQADYLLSEVRLTDLRLDLDKDVQTAGRIRLNHYKQPTIRFSDLGVNVNGLATPSDMFAREVSDLVTLTLTPEGGGAAISEAQYVERVQHNYVGNVWTTRLSLSPRPLSGFWRLGVVGAGELDRTTILALSGFWLLGTAGSGELDLVARLGYG